MSIITVLFRALHYCTFQCLPALCYSVSFITALSSIIHHVVIVGSFVTPQVLVSFTMGPDPVHPTPATYRLIAEAIEADLQDPDARYTNPPKEFQQSAKKARHDPSRERAGWVDGCSAALPRRDSAPVPVQRGRGAYTPRGPISQPPRGYYRGRGSAKGFQRGYPRTGSRGHSYRGRRGSY